MNPAMNVIGYYVFVASKPMNKVMANGIYDGEGCICDGRGCNAVLSGTNMVYHCDTNIYHSEGYDLCSKCKPQRKRKRQSEPYHNSYCKPPSRKKMKTSKHS
eukprot:609969_1